MTHCLIREIIFLKNYIYISDSGHHRILETDWTGKIQRCFGSGSPRLCDGVVEKAQFNDPQGLGNSKK